MESSEYFRLQNTALAEVEALTKQMVSGEIAQADAEKKIIAIMQTLERQTAGHIPERRAVLAMPSNQSFRNSLFFYAGCLAFFALALFGGYLCVRGVLNDQAPQLGRNNGRPFWFARADYPRLFWVSITFHAILSIGIFLSVCMGIRGRRSLLRRH